jgi:hypothetical protein
LALLSDLIIKHTKFRWEALLGSALVFMGFILVNVTNVDKEKEFFLSLWDKIRGRDRGRRDASSNNDEVETIEG